MFLSFEATIRGAELTISQTKEIVHLPQYRKRAVGATVPGSVYSTRSAASGAGSSRGLGKRTSSAACVRTSCQGDV